MPKIKNWSVKGIPLYVLVHNDTGDSIGVGSARETEYRADGGSDRY
jgi:predicted lipoprotein with Yx(FWY)xxD motif